MVVFLFLRSARATLIPAVAVPVSLVATFGVMYLAGFSLNNLSLMAAHDSHGVRRGRCDCGAGERPHVISSAGCHLQAALKGARE